MSHLYANSALSSLSTEQVQRSERATSENPSSSSTVVHTQHRRHNSLSGRVSCAKALTKSASITDISQKFYQENCTQYDPITLPDRITDLSYNCRTSDIDEVDADETRRRRLNANTKDDGFLKSITSSTLAYDEPDHLQHRFTRTGQTTIFNTRHCHEHFTDNSISDAGGCTSGMSSAFSSTCPSTVSSPLSTPTRLSPHHHHHHLQQLQQHQQQQQEPQLKCCTKSIVSPENNSNSTTSNSSSSVNNHLKEHNNLNFSNQTHHLPEHNDHHQQEQQQQQQEHYHHNHNHQHKTTTTAALATAAATAAATATIVKSGSKNIKKFDPRLGPSPYRQLLPIALCILSFATVFSILIVYMDTTEIRHQQFRLNMSRDYELYGVAQDDPQLIAFLREIHMRKYPNHFFKTSVPNTDDNGLPDGGGVSSSSDLTAHLNISSYSNELMSKMVYYITNVLQGKTDGAVIQSLTGSLGQLMTAPWLAETLNWAGVIVEPEPRRYFNLRKQNALRPRLQVVHACVSPKTYPKEVTIHNEESEVRINSLLDEETSWFNSRVKCFPLYTIMLASNRIEYDLLSLGVHGHELEILQTLPFEKIKIELISIHLMENQEDVSNYVQQLTAFLLEKSYKLQKKFGRNYFYQRFVRMPTNTTNTMPTRTRKKDILLLKTP